MDITTQEKVWFKLIGFTPEIKAKITNPFRTDKKPNAYFRLFGDVILLTDWASDEWHNLSCVKAYAKVHNLDENEAYKEIINSYERDLSFKPTIRKLVSISKKVITPVRANHNKESTEYWLKRGVTLDKRVLKCKGFWVETHEDKFFIEKKELTFWRFPTLSVARQGRMANVRAVSRLRRFSSTRPLRSVAIIFIRVYTSQSRPLTPPPRNA